MIQPARLLIVDDEDAIIRLLTQFLTSRGYLVCWADRAVTCLTALDEFPDVRVVLLDLSVGGTELLRLIKVKRRRRRDHDDRTGGGGACQTIDQPRGVRSSGQASEFVHPGEP